MTSQGFLKSYKFSNLTVSLPISLPSLLKKKAGPKWHSNPGRVPGLSTEETRFFLRQGPTSLERLEDMRKTSHFLLHFGNYNELQHYINKQACKL